MKLSGLFAIIFTTCLLACPFTVRGELEQTSWPPLDVESLVGLRVDVNLGCTSGINGLQTADLTLGEEDPSPCGHWTYKVLAKVKGYIPTDGGGTWGANVFLNQAQVVASEGGQGNGCAMENFEQEVVIFVSPGETVSLQYWHNLIDISGGYAEITAASVIKGEILGDCVGSSCHNHLNPFNESLGVDFRFGQKRLHPTNPGRTGCLRLYHREPSPLMYQPFGLCYMNFPDGPEVIIDHSNRGCIRQVIGDDGAVDIVPNPITYSYDINFYRVEDIGFKSGDVYTFTDDPYETITVRNPDQSPNINERVEVTDSRGTTTFEWEAANNGWTLIEPDEESQERRYVSTTGNIRTEILEVVDDATQTVQYREEEKFRIDSWGEPLISRTLDPGGSLPKLTQYQYWTNSTDNGFKQIRQVQYPGGRWEKYDYDSLGRLSRKMNSLLDYGLVTDTNLCQVLVYDYAALPGSGDNLSRTNTPRMEIEFIGGKEIARSYRVFKDYQEKDILCTVPGAVWTDGSNLVTTTNRISGQFYNNLISTIEFPDGTIELREYFDEEVYGELDYQNIYRGEPNLARDAVIAGTRRWMTFDEFDRLDREISIDIEDPYFSFGKTYYLFDDFGTPQRVGYSDSTFEESLHGCCGPTQVTARDGSLTQYSYDERGLKIAETAPGAGNTGSAWIEYSYNAKKQLLTEGLSGSALPLKAYAYGLDGSLTTETNALGGVTTYLESFDSTNQRYTKTTTYPDGGTRVERHYLDGRLERVTGTAVAPQRFEYNVEQLNGFWCRTTKTVPLDGGGNDTLQWEKTYVDAVGRTIRREYAAAMTPYPYEETTYNDLGQRVAYRDPDGVTTLFGYNGRGQLEYHVVDMDQDGIIDLDGTDRITRNKLISAGTKKQDSFTYVLETNGVATETLVDEGTRRVSYLIETELVYQDAATGLATSRSTSFDPPNRSRTTTTLHPDLTQTREIYTDGLLRTLQTLDGSSQVTHQVDYLYDAHGRQSQVIDSIKGKTLYTYNDAGLVHDVTVQTYGAGVNQTTTTLYDTSLRPIEVILPDGNRQHTVYTFTGQVKRRYGSRTYPVDYTYDAQNRLHTQTTWQDHAGAMGAAVTRRNYDPYRGWLTSKDHPDPNTGQAPLVEGSNGPNYTYTAAGRQASRTWLRGVVTTYTHNAAGEVSHIGYSDTTPSVTYTHDRRGRLASVSRDGIITSYTYNLAGQVLNEGV